MSDLLFIKQLNAQLWLGLRLPRNMKVTYAADGTATVGTDWSYEEPTRLPDGIQQLWIPMLDPGAAEMPFKWVAVDIADRHAPSPFRRFEQAFEDDTEVLRTLLGDSVASERRKEQFKDQVATLRQTPRAMLRALDAYRELEPADLGRHHGDAREPGARLLAILHEAMGGQANSVNIDLFSGLVFVASGTLAAADGPEVFIDPTPAQLPPPLTLTARQGSDRVLLRPSAGGALLTNSSVLGLFPGGHLYSPYYRLHRGLGVEGRAPWRSALIIIPAEEPQPLAGNPLAPPPPRPQERPWAERPFQVVNPVNDGLVGELLNYRLDLFNLHGRRLHVGRVLVMRQDVSPPAAPTRGSARLVVKPGAGSAPVCGGMEIRMDFAAAERAALEHGDGSLQPVVYALSSSRIPTGFYGDADDAALAIGRLLSDLDPAAVLASGAASAEVDAGVRELADARLSAQGLTEIRFLAGELKPRANVKRAQSPTDRADRDTDEFMAWELKLELADFSTHLEGGKGMRLFLAVRRNLPEDVFAGAQRTLESVVIPVDMSIVDADGAIINSVQHFEDFWTDGTKAPVAEERHARIARAPEAAAGKRPAGIVGSLQVQIDHGLVADRWPDIGGYRVWMREAAGTQSPWVPLAVVQVVPPLVKAYAPIETGRLWDIEEPVLPTPAAGTPAKPQFQPAHAQRLFRTDGQAGAGKEPDPYQKPADLVAEQVTAKGTTLLAFIKDLASKGFAAEYLLSVSQRRRLERQGIALLPREGTAAPAAAPGDGLPEGNWLLLKDQNGHYLGRAWAFWGDAVTQLQLKKQYTLVEVPNTQDTVATDDFGKATWTWHGLTDEWGHDFEWVVEPLNRHAPLLQRISAAEAAGATAMIEAPAAPRPRTDRYRRGAPAVTPASAAPPGGHFVHKVRVQRTAPLAGRFGIVQRAEPARDAFVFRVLPPEEFRVAGFNSVARSAFGVHKMRVLHARRKFMHPEEYPNAKPEDAALVASWVGERRVPAGSGERLRFSSPGASAAYQDSQDLPFFGDLDIDEPACLALDLTLQPVADGVLATEVDPATNKRSPTRTVLQDARRQAMEFRADLPAGRPTLTGGDKTLRIPLARLHWTYRGTSAPPLSLLPGAPPELADRHLLELPDPLARVNVFRREQNDFVLVAAFSGTRAPAAEGIDKFEKGNSAWGAFWGRSDTFEKASTGLLASDPGAITLQFTSKTDPEDLLVVWTREAAQRELKVERTQVP